MKILVSTTAPSHSLSLNFHVMLFVKMICENGNLQATYRAILGGENGNPHSMQMTLTLRGKASRANIKEVEQRLNKARSWAADKHWREQRVVNTHNRLHACVYESCDWIHQGVVDCQMSLCDFSSWDCCDILEGSSYEWLWMAMNHHMNHAMNHPRFVALIVSGISTLDSCKFPPERVGGLWKSLLWHILMVKI